MTQIKVTITSNQQLGPYPKLYGHSSADLFDCCITRRRLPLRWTRSVAMFGRSTTQMPVSCHNTSWLITTNI